MQVGAAPCAPPTPHPFLPAALRRSPPLNRPFSARKTHCPISHSGTYSTSRFSPVAATPDVKVTANKVIQLNKWSNRAQAVQSGMLFGDDGGAEREDRP